MAIASQLDLDQVLDRMHVVPVEVDPRGPLPRRRSYDAIRDLPATSFSFTARELIHAIGCKTAALPMNEADECLKAGYLYTKVLDLGAANLCFRDGMDSDLQTNRSMEVGLGMMCLIASRCWTIPWDQLGTIPGQGMRFDYRGSGNGLECIFEAKGTKYRDKQAGQIRHGLEKKQAHHDQNEHFDVELIVSTHVGVDGARPRILIADPEIDIRRIAFGSGANEFFHLRHFARVMQFIGAPRAARKLYLRSNEYLGWAPYAYELTPGDFPEFEVVTVFDRRYHGRWFDYWIPPGSRRYGHLVEKDHWTRDVAPRIRAFQGVSERVLEQLLRGGMWKVSALTERPHSKPGRTSDGQGASVFPDETVFAAEFLGGD